MTTVIPFRPRRRPPGSLSTAAPPSGLRAANSQRRNAIRIDATVSLYQLMTGLQSVGLSLRREAATGVYIISPQQPRQPPL